MNGFYNIGRRFFFDEFLFGHADLRQESQLEFDDFFDFFMSKHDGIKDICFRYLFGSPFDHEDGVFCPCYDDIHVAGFALCHRRIDDKLAIDAAYADTGDWAGKGNMGHAQRYGSADHGSDFRCVVVIYAEVIGYDVDVMTVCLGEQRADRAVDQAGKERRRFRRFTFPFDEAAGNLPYGVHFFFIIYRERKEIGIFPCFFRSRSGNKYSRIAIADQSSTARLFGKLSYFDDQGTTGKIHLEYLFFHSFSSL